MLKVSTRLLIVLNNLTLLVCACTPEIRVSGLSLRLKLWQSRVLLYLIPENPL